MQRLKRRTDFRAAAQGAKAPGRAFVLQARRRDEAGQETGPVRVGFTVSRQVGNAVQRNRVRRRLREIVKLAPAAALCAGHDYVLIGRRAALELPFGDLMRELDAALRRIHPQKRDERGGSVAGKAGTIDERPPHQAGSPRPSPPRKPSPKPGRSRKPRQKPARHEH